MKYLSFFVIVGLIYQCDVVPVDPQQHIDKSKQGSESALSLVTNKFIKDLDAVPFQEQAIPRSITANGEVEHTPSSKWTSGFYPGTLWHLYGYSKDERLRERAEQWLTTIEQEKLDSTTHDLGFKIFCSFGTAWRLTGNDDYKDVFVTAARTLSTRYSPVVEALRSWDHHDHIWDFPVIIDNMMNLELLFEAANASGDSTLYEIAVNHANTTLLHHFRDDHSSYHVIGYDPQTGQPTKKNTHQGYSHESAWSRGQAWGLYGYTMSYRYTKDPHYLTKAHHIADYIINHPRMPEDGIPYWDYDAPNIPDELRDVSAATVAASALYELQQYASDKRVTYRSFADKILYSLSQDEYQTDAAPFYLDHSVGSIPGEFEIDVPITYADYYYVEALIRQDQLLSTKQ